MKLTLDRMCIQTKKLCASCIELMDKGEVSEFDVTFGNILMNLAKSNKYLNDLTVTKIVPTEKNIFVIVKKGHLSKVDKAEEQIMEKLGRNERRNIRFLEKSKSAKTLLEGVLAPIKPLSSTIVIIPPDGTKELKVQIKEKDKKSLFYAAAEISKLTKSVLGMDSHFVYV